MDIIELFNKCSKNRDGLALLPIKGLIVGRPFEIEGIHFSYARDIKDLDILLRKVDERAFLPIEEISDDMYKSELSGDGLRRFTTSLSGISKEIFRIQHLLYYRQL